MTIATIRASLDERRSPDCRRSPLPPPSTLTLPPRRNPKPKQKHNHSASYRNKENIDLSRVPSFQRTAADTGSPESQIARLSARVQQMSKHLIANRKDHGSKRGLERALAARRSLMQYLYSKDRETYDRLCVELGIRNVVKGHTVQQPGQAQ